MLWKPATNGEQLFLSLHERIGGTLNLVSRADVDLGVLISPEDFSEFVQLTATMEIFFRCVRSATGYLEEMSDPRASDLAEVVRREVGLPPQFGRDRELREILLRPGSMVSKTSHVYKIPKAALGAPGR